ncbi:hypothetical protein Adt_10005 [Abeliophyllum distichum]|uniref:Uncharacterized protein n=1 Tax=Abeliophyllum distichum TaxID=126358 RepID=A0ABD1UIS1_9LAMI
MKRIPRIKFPQRHPKSSSGAASQHQETSAVGDGPRIFFSRSPSSTTVVGKASDQPKRTPVSQEEIEAILLGGCILNFSRNLALRNNILTSLWLSNPFLHIWKILLSPFS